MESMGETINRLVNMETRDELASFTVFIDITDEDINTGKADNCNECPAALALARALPAATYVAVAGRYAKVDVDSVTYKAASTELMDFVINYDYYAQWHRNEHVVTPQRIRLHFVEMV